MTQKFAKHFILFLAVLCLNVYAPGKTKTLAVKFYDKFDGSYWQKHRAYKGFMEWPEHFGHTQQEIWDLIDRETEGSFKAMAFNARTFARGPCQVRVIALEDIESPPGKSFFSHVKNGERSVKVLNKSMVYDPYYNVFAGSAYYAKCKKMAQPQKIGRFEFSKEDLAKVFYVAGIGTWHNSLRETLRYIQE